MQNKKAAQQTTAQPLPLYMTIYPILRNPTPLYIQKISHTFARGCIYIIV